MLVPWKCHLAKDHGKEWKLMGKNQIKTNSDSA